MVREHDRVGAAKIAAAPDVRPLYHLLVPCRSEQLLLLRGAGGLRVPSVALPRHWEHERAALVAQTADEQLGLSRVVLDAELTRTLAAGSARPGGTRSCREAAPPVRA